LRAMNLTMLVHTLAFHSFTLDFVVGTVVQGFDRLLARIGREVAWTVAAFKVSSRRLAVFNKTRSLIKVRTSCSTSDSWITSRRAIVRESFKRLSSIPCLRSFTVTPWLLIASPIIYLMVSLITTCSSRCSSCRGSWPLDLPLLVVRSSSERHVVRFSCLLLLLSTLTSPHIFLGWLVLAIKDRLV